MDSGVADGVAIGVHYDAMLAKVAARAGTREEALRLLAYALERATVHGPVTNRDLLVRLLRHPEVLRGGVPTTFLERALAELTAEPDGAGQRVRRAALAAALADACGRHPFGGWRNVPSGPQVKRYRSEPDGAEHEVRYRLGRDGLWADGHDGVRLVRAAPDAVLLESDGVRRRFAVSVYGDAVYVDAPDGSVALTALSRFPDAGPAAEPGSLLAPMPGTVLRVADVAVGDRVAAGTPLVWLEAMKMEHRVAAPADGTLTALHAEPGGRWRSARSWPC